MNTPAHSIFGVGLQLPPSISPSPPPPQGGSRRYVRSEPLIMNGSNGSYSDLTATFKVRHPSSRLHAIACFTYEPVSQEDATFPGGGPGAWLVNMDVWIRPEGMKARMMRGNNIFTSLPAPTTYEAVTMADEWRGRVVVPANGTAIIPGTLWLTVAWEPAAGESPIPDAELEKIFKTCHIETGALQTFQTVGE